MDKEQRQSILREVIQMQTIHTQEYLLQALEEKGVNVTQSTISRDMKEIGVVKHHQSDGQSIYVLQESISRQKQLKHLSEVMVDHVESMTAIQFVLVLKTTLEMANVIAAILDEGLFNEIVGTLAGADTIVIFCKDNDDCLSLQDKLQQMIDR